MEDCSKAAGKRRRYGYGTQAGIFFNSFSDSFHSGNGAYFFHQPVRSPKRYFIKCRYECLLIFDKWNPWYSWGLPAVRYFNLQKLVSISQKVKKSKIHMDKLKLRVYNTIHTVVITSAVSSRISRIRDVSWDWMSIFNSIFIIFSSCIIAAMFQI